MSSSKLTPRNSDLKRKQLSACTSMEFLGIDRTSSDARCNFVSDTVTVDGRLKIGSAEQNPLFNAKNTLLDGDSEPPRIVRKTADDVWREIVAGKKSEQQPKKEMMTLEDFLLKAEAAEEAASGGDGAIVEVKEEELSGRIFANKNSGAIGKVIGVGGFGRGRGKRSLSLSEPLDKATQQREIRMIKNRESAARSRERKQVEYGCHFLC